MEKNLARAGRVVRSGEGLLKSATAKSMLAECYQLESTASGYIAQCPECGLRFAVNVKNDTVLQEFNQLLLAHVEDERVTLQNDADLRDWLERNKGEGLFLQALKEAASRADYRAYRILRPVLLEIREAMAPANA